MIAILDWLVGCLRIEWFIYRIQMASDLPFLDAASSRWIFVGGKGGVGKTTTSYPIAVSLTRFRGRVLLLSTDPASNIGDTFRTSLCR
jgi:flagellar biosynthesis GTPase FlhF